MTPDEPSVSPSDEETPGPVSTAVCLGERAYNHNKVQLVVCDDAVATGGVMGTCTFDYPGMSGTMDVVQADHTFVVREARTGRQVADFSMQGTAGAEESCPSSATDSGDTQIAQAVNDDAVAAKLRSLYEGPARKT